MSLTSTKTTLARVGQVQRRWQHFDAEGAVVGRLASRIAVVLQGKHKPIYTPHVDTGDFVIVTNAEKIVFTGRKLQDRMYRHHSGFLGGLKEMSAADMLRRHPDRIIRLAVQRMMPRTRLGRAMLKKLKVYAGPEHPHGSQETVKADTSAFLRKDA